MELILDKSAHRIPWDKGKLAGQKLALKLKEIWEIPTSLQINS